MDGGSNAYREASSPEPELRFEAGGLWTELPFSEAYLRTLGAKAPPVTDPVTAPVTAPVGEYVAKLIRLLGAKGAMSNEEIREAFALKSRRHLRDTYINPGLADRLIEPTIPDKPTSRLQNYRLTPAGHAALKSIGPKSS